MPVALAGNHMPKRIKRLMFVFISQNGESVAALHSNNLQTVWKAQKHQHPRQFELIILSTFASSRSMAGLVSAVVLSWGGPRHLTKALRPTSWCRARQRWCRRRPRHGHTRHGHMRSHAMPSHTAAGKRRGG